MNESRSSGRRWSRARVRAPRIGRARRADPLGSERGVGRAARARAGARRPARPPPLRPCRLRTQRLDRRTGHHGRPCRALPAAHAGARNRQRARRRPLVERRRRVTARPRLPGRGAEPRPHGAGAARPPDRGPGSVSPRRRGARRRALPVRRQGRSRRHLGPRRLRTGVSRPTRASTPRRPRALRGRRRRVLHAGAARPAAVVVHRGGCEPHLAAGAPRSRGEHRADLPRASRAAPLLAPERRDLRAPWGDPLAASGRTRGGWRTRSLRSSLDTRSQHTRAPEQRVSR